MIYAFLFSFLCFLLCSLGAGIVFFIKKSNNAVDAFLHSFASGVMIASSIFSLLIPAITYCEEVSLKDYIVLPLCFILSGIMIIILDQMTNKSERGAINKPMLITSIALHNIPEGMSVGFAFALASILGTDASFVSAVMIALGIGIQNIPEGSAVSFPLYSNGESKLKSFLISAGAGFLEVPSAVIAYIIGLNLISVLPFMLAFSAATMIIVATSDLMPEAVSKNKKTAVISMLVGFIFMMILDLALG